MRSGRRSSIMSKENVGLSPFSKLHKQVNLEEPKMMTREEIEDEQADDFFRQKKKVVDILRVKMEVYDSNLKTQ